MPGSYHPLGGHAMAAAKSTDFPPMRHPDNLPPRDQAGKHAKQVQMAGSCFVRVAPAAPAIMCHLDYPKTLGKELLKCSLGHRMFYEYFMIKSWYNGTSVTISFQRTSDY